MKITIQQISFILCTLVLGIGQISAQSTTPSEALIKLNGTFQRNVFTPLSTTQVVVFQNLIPGEAYLLSVPDHADLCQPDVVAPDIKNAQYDAATHVLRFTATASELSLQLNYPCTWGANPPSQYISLVCETCAKKELKQYLKSLAVLEVSTGISAEDLVRNILVGGDCFDISNVTFKGKSDQIGVFSNGASNIGFSSGAIIATGDCSIASGPNDQDSASGGYGESTPDSDLSLMSGSSSNFDLADIEFDIIPTQTPLTFEYVFASEEYCEYVGTTFRDALGFFISGPGISGPYSDSAQNIAVLASGTPVTVNNVNHITNSGFYTNNTPASGNLCGQNSSSSPAVNEVQYDGFTKKLTAVASVIPCEQYHIKMKICDVGDGIFDSAVFLKGGDLGGGKNASVDWVVAGQTGLNTVTEGSGTVELIFHRVGGNHNLPLAVSYQILGTATQSVDYTGVPLATVIIPAGQSSLLFTVNILNDMIAEGPEFISIKLLNACSCVNPLATLTILDPVPPSFLLTSAVNNIHVCAGTDTAFTVQLTSISGYNNPVNLAVTGAPANAIVTISPNPAGADDTVLVNISGLNIAGDYTMTVNAVSDTITRTASVALRVSSGMPGVPEATSPTNGASGLPTSTLLHWTNATDADRYLVEVATNPSFSADDLVSSQTVNDTSTTVSSLQTETVYYWRTRAINACNSGIYSPIYAFQTGKNLCNQHFSSTDVPKEIPTINGSESWATASSLDIAENKAINDINVSLAFTQHNIGDLSAWLVAPFGDSIGVQLFDRPGFPATINGCAVEEGALTFDTESGPGVQEADALETQCDTATPPLTGTYKPIESLYSLHGKYTAGTWKLKVVSRHGGGAITDWGLSFCLSEAITAGDILANAPLVVSAGQNGTILQSNLNMGITGSPEQGVFTLLSLPQHGLLSLNGITLGLGDQFSQADINHNLLIYNNNCDGITTDHFRFDALDEANKAWVHDAVFNINIITSNNLSLTAGVQKTVGCAGESNGEIIAISSGGQMPYAYSLNGGTSQTSNIFSNLAAGTYTVMVTDNSACNAVSTTATLIDPPALQIATSVLSDVITVQASGGTPPYNYSLNGNTPQSSGVFSGLEAGAYSVICMDANGCTVSATNLVVIVGATEPSEAWGLTVSPNPSTGLFDLRLQHAPEILRVEVFDVTGQLLQSLNLQPVGGQLTTTLNLQHLPTGTYFLRLCDGQKWGGVRLFKENGR
jgi:subtilisin-like proprotein convertase family protein